MIFMEKVQFKKMKNGNVNHRLQYLYSIKKILL